MLAQLQRTAGNQATVRALTAARHGSGAAQIMRFPSGVLDKPLKKKEWKSYTKTVAKSGEGVSGGVFFFGSKRGGVKNVVVKPEPSADTKNEKKVKETATERANELLASAGVSVPKGRTVYCDSAEGQDIMATAQKVGGFDLSLSGMGGYEQTDFFQVMSTASGSSLSSTAKKAATDADPQVLAGNVNQLVLLLSTSNVQTQLASMMVQDAIAGNTDRVMKHGLANIGNVMITKGHDNKALPRALQSRITAIDSEASTSSFEANKQRDYYANLVDLGKNPATYVDRLLESVQYFLDQGNPQAGAMFAGHPQFGALRDGLLTALSNAAMREARLGAGKQDSKPEKPWESELRERRKVLWNVISG
jgi:hypothetical protein